MAEENPTDTNRLMAALDRIETALVRIDTARGGCAALASRHTKLRAQVTRAVASLDELLERPSDG